MNEIEFGKAFATLAGTPGHFPWQWELYQKFVAGEFPPSCNLPTGLGKTSVIHIWLLALATNPDKVPRRLVYVVNRRTVVDQSTDEAVKIRDRLRDAPELADIVARLRRLCASSDPKQVPLAISTLRGQFADNREWSADPSRPAVICGTVDMIGSRLLFSGYGSGFKTRPLHAGFLGQDSLIVHDEAHLEPAFQKLLTAIECEQTGGRMNEKGECEKGDKPRDFRPLQVMELTATSRADGTVPFALSDKDYHNATVDRRVKARKALHLRENADEKKLADEIAGLALAVGKEYPRTAILVYVRKVDDVEKIVTKLRKEKQKVQQLTGTLRGLERDELPKDPVFARFLPKAESADETVYLVCTSAGEVGVNISADHLACDLSTFESMAQRFGRVNRFGLRDDTEIHVVHPKQSSFDRQDPVEVRLKKTLDLLEQLNGDASPAALNNLDPTSRQEAFAPTPTILPVSDIHFDAWALTTIRDRLPGRPHVEPYLHGVAEWQPPETHVAWREEVGIVTGNLLERYDPEELLDQYPLKPHELLRDASTRVYDRLKKLKAGSGTPVWIVSDDGSVEVAALGDLIAAGKEKLERQVVLLPPSAGGLANGFLTSDSPLADDVSHKWENEKGEHRRVRVWDKGPVSREMRLILTIDTRPDVDDAEDEQSGRRYWHWFELSAGGDTDGSRSNKFPVLWQTHTDDVVVNTKAITAKLLSAELQNTYRIAAECHDLGKRRKLFQRVLGNTKYPQRILAKSGKKAGPIEERYRHEFGSLLDAESPGRNSLYKEFAALDSDLRELVLHLIAAHHGRGRPHFPADEAFDPDPSDRDAAQVAGEVPRRFAQLQGQYGRWGLAYLESLLRAADYAASASPSEFVKEEGQ